MINFQNLLLLMLSRLERQRTVSSAYHILRGKKSSQTIQDIHLFQLKDVYGIYPKLTKSQYQYWINYFKQIDYLEINNEDFKITKPVDPLQYKLLSKFSGFNYHKTDQLWMQTVQLLCQTLSNLSHGSNQFIPIHDHKKVQFIVRKLIKTNELNSLVHQFYNELEGSLNLLTDFEASVFVYQLTGAKRIGMSKRQVAEMFDIYEEDVHVITVSIIHQLLKEIIPNQASYPLLNSTLIFKERHTLTNSAERTYDLIKKGYSLDEIMTVRQLKMSTIQDHVIEIATQIDDFNINNFVNADTQNIIFDVISHTTSKRLKEIKSKLNEEITYFQIRLVLAKFDKLKASVDENERTSNSIRKRIT